MPDLSVWVLTEMTFGDVGTAGLEAWSLLVAKINTPVQWHNTERRDPGQNRSWSLTYTLALSRGPWSAASMAKWALRPCPGKATSGEGVPGQNRSWSLTYTFGAPGQRPAWPNGHYAPAQNVFNSLHHIWADHRLSISMKIRLYRTGSSFTHGCKACFLINKYTGRDGVGGK